MSDQRPCAVDEAVARALSIAGKGGQYWLGTGDYRPEADGTDLPWTTNNGGTGSDCCGFAITWCYKLTRHRPGFNRGAWSTCDDDINCDSAVEDARGGWGGTQFMGGQQELFELCETPEVGAMLLYPSIHLRKHVPPFYMCGHVSIIIDCSKWDAAAPSYSDLVVAQCHGPNGFKPGVVITDGSIWQHHDQQWPLPQHRSAMIRAKP